MEKNSPAWGQERPRVLCLRRSSQTPCPIHTQGTITCECLGFWLVLWPGTDERIFLTTVWNSPQDLRSANEALDGDVHGWQTQLTRILYPWYLLSVDCSCRIQFWGALLTDNLAKMVSYWQKTPIFFLSTISFFSTSYFSVIWRSLIPGCQLVLSLSCCCH